MVCLGISSTGNIGIVVIFLEDVSKIDNKCSRIQRISVVLIIVLANGRI